MHLSVHKLNTESYIAVYSKITYQYTASSLHNIQGYQKRCIIVSIAELILLVVMSCDLYIYMLVVKLHGLPTVRQYACSAKQPRTSPVLKHRILVQSSPGNAYCFRWMQIAFMSRTTVSCNYMASFVISWLPLMKVQDTQVQWSLTFNDSQSFSNNGTGIEELRLVLNLTSYIYKLGGPVLV